MGAYVILVNFFRKLKNNICCYSNDPKNLSRVGVNFFNKFCVSRRSFKMATIFCIIFAIDHKLNFIIACFAIQFNSVYQVCSTQIKSLHLHETIVYRVPHNDWFITSPYVLPKFHHFLNYFDNWSYTRLFIISRFMI